MKTNVDQPEKSIRSHFYDLVEALSIVQRLVSMEVHRLNEAEIIEMVLSILIEYQDIEHCSLYLLREDVLEYAGEKGWEDYFADDNSTVQLSADRLIQVCKNRKKLMRGAVDTKVLQHCHDYQQEFSQEGAESETSNTLNSLMSLPIIGSKKVFGVINLFHDRPNHGRI